MQDDHEHARQMENQTSDTRRWDLPSHLARRPGYNGPQHLEIRTSQEMITSTPSSCKMGSRVDATKGQDAAEPAGTISAEFHASIPKHMGD